MRRFLDLTSLVSLAFLTACSTGSQKTSLQAILAHLQVSAQNPNIVVGQTEQMQATGLYGDGSSHDVTASVSWSSSNSNIATVAKGGLLTAVNSGQAVISADMQGITGTFNVTVAPALVSIAVTPATATIARSTTQQFIATGTYSDNSTQNITTSVSWSSSTPAVATISSTAPTMGLARAVSSGDTQISASSSSVSGGASLTVSSASVTSFAITPASLALPLGTSKQFTATAGFSDGSAQDVTDVTQWQSSNTSVAPITISGLVTARNIGNSTITGAFGGMTSSSSVTVNAANLTSITIQPGNATLAQGTRRPLTAIGTFNDGSTRDITFNANWTSSNTATATVSGGGVSGISPGMVTITATLGAISASTSVTVTNATIVSLSLSPSSLVLPTGGALRFHATGTFSDSSTQDLTNQVQWSSSNTAVATVDNTASNGGFTVAVSAGVSNVSAVFTFGADSQTGNVSVTVSTATLASLKITPSTAQIAPGSGIELTATGTFTDGTQENMNALTAWTSSDASVASVTPGSALGQSAGTVTITAHDGPVSATANLLVEAATLDSIEIVPQNSTVPARFGEAFQAVGTFSNGDTQDLTHFVTWTSSNPAIATISVGGPTAGFASALEAGSTTISAAFSGLLGTTTLKVSNATLTSITVTPSSTSIAIGQTQQFSATGSFSDGSTLDLTRQVNWTSSNPNVAAISAIALADGLSSGTTTIQAETNAVSGTAILTVQ